MGLPKNEGGERQWNVWRSLKGHFADPSVFSEFNDVYHSKALRPGLEEANSLLKSAVTALRSFWLSLAAALSEADEAKRFFEIETSPRNIFLHRQFAGIQINSEELERHLNEVKKDKYLAYRQVAEILDISPSGLNYRNVERVIANTDARHLTEFETGPSLESYFQIAALNSRFAEVFDRYMKATRNFSILVRLSDPSGKVHPVFNTIGTITGRIMVAEPYLQQLKRAYRSVISADDGKELIYLDFAQYEPGILADLSGDECFIDEYNTEDLYLSLSRSVFGDAEHRDIAKRIFLSFCYGMRESNIARLLVGAEPEDGELALAEQSVVRFFARYPKLKKFKRAEEDKLVERGFSASLNGNRRYRLQNGSLSYKEKRWAISQVVQGTASLIFKDALCGLTNQFGNDALLLPMHDAILMQLDPCDLVEGQVMATEIMKQSFRKYCHKTEPKIVEGNFCE